MLISLYAFLSVAFIDLEFSVQSFQDLVVNWDWVVTNLDTFEVVFAFNDIKPRMRSNLFNCKSLFRVSIQNIVKQVFCFFRNITWGLKVS